jgi:hypothetical protein
MCDMEQEETFVYVQKEKKAVGRAGAKEAAASVRDKKEGAHAEGRRSGVKRPTPIPVGPNYSIPSGIES